MGLHKISLAPSKFSFKLKILKTKAVQLRYFQQFEGAFSILQNVKNFAAVCFVSNIFSPIVSDKNATKATCVLFN